MWHILFAAEICIVEIFNAAEICIAEIFFMQILYTEIQVQQKFVCRFCIFFYADSVFLYAEICMQILYAEICIADSVLQQVCNADFVLQILYYAHSVLCSFCILYYADSV